MTNFERLFKLCHMSEEEKELFELSKIENLRKHGVATWDDEKKYHEIRRRRVIREHEKRNIA